MQGWVSAWSVAALSVFAGIAEKGGPQCAGRFAADQLTQLVLRYASDDGWHGPAQPGRVSVQPRPSRAGPCHPVAHQTRVDGALERPGPLPGASGETSKGSRSNDSRPLGGGPDFGFVGVGQTAWPQPDPHLAVGPDYLVAVTNGALAIFDKAGGKTLQMPLEGPDGFWGSLFPSAQVFTPEVLFDPHSSRFLVLAGEDGEEDRSFFLFAVSETANPNDAWHHYRLDIADLVGSDMGAVNLAVDAQAVYLTCDDLNPDRYVVCILDKAEVLGGVTPTPRTLLIEDGVGLGIPVTYDAAARAQYLIEAFRDVANTQIRLHAVTDPLGTPQRVTTNVSVPSYTLPENPPQAGTSVRPLLTDARFYSCVYRGGSLWAVHHQGSSRVRVRWYEFRLNGWPGGGTPYLAQWGDIDPGTPVRTFCPSIGVDEAGHVAVNFAQSGPDEYISMRRATRLAGAPAGTFNPPVLVKESSAPYGHDSWGAYSAAVPDPFVPGTFWLHHEYTPGADTWNTWIARVVLEALRLDVLDALPATMAPEVPLVFRVQVLNGRETLVPEGLALHYRFGPGQEYGTAGTTELGAGVFEVTVPAAACGSVVEFYLSALGDLGTTVYAPSAAPEETFSYMIGEPVVIFDDDFESDQGWTETYIPGGGGTPAGFWERVDPNGTSAAPEDDYSADGTFCYVTQNGTPGGPVGAADVDAGTFVLTSPRFDLTFGGEISYARWFYWSGYGEEDFLDVELSGNDGEDWVLVERVVGQTGWVEHGIAVSDYIAPSANVRLRFVTSDVPSDSITEAAVDEVVVVQYACSQCAFAGDLNADCHLDLEDWEPLAACVTGPGVPPAASCGCFDFNKDGRVDLQDQAAFQVEYTGSDLLIPDCP